METEEGRQTDKPQMRMVHYYYINYQLFVNVIKYKLDQMRRRIEAMERQVRSVCVCVRACMCVCVCVCVHACTCTSYFVPLTQAQNRMSYICQTCQSTFSDLDVDKLFDLAEQRLKYVLYH